MAVALSGIVGPSPAGARTPEGGDRPPPSEGRTGSAERPAFVPGELLVRFQASTSGSARTAVRVRQGLQKIKDLPLPGLELVRVKGAGRIPDRASQVQAEAAVRYAHPNHLWYPAGVPPVNDPEFEELWGLHNPGGRPGWTEDADIDWPEAQQIAAPLAAQGEIVVAVTDTGVDIDHPDLADRIWTNPSPDPVKQDLHGWDFYNNDNSVFDEVDGDDHGTHVAGTIAAVMNNGVNVTGVGQPQIMPLKFLGPDGGATSDAILAIDYAIDNGADVINASWGGGGNDLSLKAKIEEAGTQGILFVAAAGNDGKNTDSSPHYPSSYTSPSIISVAATTASDGLASFSNYGATSVDLGAPGASILSTVPRLGKVVLTGPDIPGGATYHTAYHTFGLEGIGNTQHRRDILQAALSWMGVATSDSILVVPDDGSASFVANYTGALSGLGYSNVTTAPEVGFPSGNNPNCNDHGPSAATMSAHKAVIWFTGATWRCTLTSTDRTNIDNYLGGTPKGKLLLFGQDIGCDLTLDPACHLNSGGPFPSSFLNEVLKVDYVADYDVNFRVSGMSGTPYASVPTVQLNGADPATTSGGQRWSSAIAARSGAVTAMRGAYTTWFSGTSMATPHVAGAVSHLLAKFPEIDHMDIKARIMNRGDPLAALSGKTVSGKRLNLHRALQGDGPAAPTGLSAVPKAAGRIDLSWTASAGPDLEGYNVYRGTTSGFTPGPGNRRNTSPLTNTSYSDETNSSGTFHYVVRAVDTEGTESIDSNRVSATADATPPQVSGTSPIDEAEGVPPTAPVTATFNEAVDPATVTTSSFTLEEGGVTPVSGSVSYNGTTRTATFTPDATLDSATAYTAEITADVTDLVGNPLAVPVTWSFTTADVHAPVAVVETPTAGALLAESPTTISGSASDDQAVTEVQVAIQDAGGQWWNGAGFQPGEAWHAAEMDPPGGDADVDWIFDWALPSSDGGPFTVRARALDGTNVGEPHSVAVTVDTVAPTGSLAIDEGTHTPTTDVTLTLTGSDGGAGSLEMRIANDGPPTGGWEPFAASVPWELSAGPPDGARTVYAQLRDAAGNESDVLEASITLDTTPPEITGAAADPPVFSPALNATTTITASISDASQVEWGVQVGPDKSLFFDEGQGPDVEVVWDGADANDGEYTFEISAVDAAGNEAVPVTGTVTVDGTPPVVTIDSAPDPLTNQASATFAFSADEDADFECRLDGGGWESCTSPKEYPGLGDGDHTFDVRASDAAGNIGQEGHAWTVDATPPTIESRSPAEDAADVPISANVTVTFSEPVTGATIEVTDEGDGPVAGAVSYDGATDTATFDPNALLEFSTQYTVEVTGTDAAGNPLAGQASWSFTTAAQPSEPELEDTPGAINTTSTNFTFSSDEGEGFECRWYGKHEDPPEDWQECASPYEVEGLAEGEYVFEVRVVVGDKVGTPAVREFIVDMTAPTNPSVSRQGGRFQGSRTFNLSFSAIDGLAGVASYQVEVRSAPWNGGFGSWSPWNEVDVAAGEVSAANEAEAAFTGGRGRTYCFRTAATDLAGNTSTLSPQTCTAVPLNNTQLTHRKKWAKKKGDGYYENTYSQTRTRGAALIRTGVRAKRLAIIATRCGTCGTIDVFWGKKRVKRINLSRGTRGRAQIIPVKTFKKVRKGRVRIRVVTRNRVVRIEGLGVSRV